MKKKCNKCKLLINNICQIFKEDMREGDGCPKFVDETYTCDLCGCEFISETAVLNEDKVYCSECGHRLGTCYTCRLGNVCEFETNPSGPSKMVQKTVNQGGMTASITVPNPARVEFFCVRNNCPCFNKELQICMKTCNNCNKWKE